MELNINVPSLEELEEFSEQPDAVEQALPVPEEPPVVAAEAPAQAPQPAAGGYQTPGWLKPFRQPPLCGS